MTEPNTPVPASQDHRKTNPQWQEARRLVLERDQGCRLCGSTELLQVHHRTYEHEGDELAHLDDLTCLCRPCHMYFHTSTAAGRFLWVRGPKLNAPKKRARRTKKPVIQPAPVVIAPVPVVAAEPDTTDWAKQRARRPKKPVIWTCQAEPEDEWRAKQAALQNTSP